MTQNDNYDELSRNDIIERLRNAEAKAERSEHWARQAERTIRRLERELSNTWV